MIDDAILDRTDRWLQSAILIITETPNADTNGWIAGFIVTVTPLLAEVRRIYADPGALATEVVADLRKQLEYLDALYDDMRMGEDQ